MDLELKSVGILPKTLAMVVCMDRSAPQKGFTILPHPSVLDFGYGIDRDV